MADTFHQRGMYFASMGFPFAIVDARGRGDSEGNFRPRIQEASDGFDVVEWLAQQSYCNGKVAMWGGSYAGYDQWATAKEFPPHLATIVPVAAPYYGVDLPMRNNIFSPYAVQWLAYVGGRSLHAQLFSDSAFWSQAFRRWYESGRAFRDIDSICGVPSKVFQEYVQHPEIDEYWEAYNPLPHQYARLQIPILTITGCYDDNQPGALEHYKRHILYAAPEASARHYLVIGPWDHPGTRTPAREFAGITVGDASLIDLSELHCQWYEWTMGGGPKPLFLRKRVSYYVMGADCWRYADTLDAVTAYHHQLFLDSPGRSANSLYAAGRLQRTVGTGLPDVFTFDPCALGPELNVEERTPGLCIVDQSITHALSGRELVYHSDPFDCDVEISGFFKLIAWISIDCADTDLYVSVHEVALNGSSVRLSTDAIRARYRESLRQANLVQTTDPLCYRFERFTFVSRLIPRGHRLRVIIAPIGRLIDSSFTQRNFNGGGIVANETSRDARAVTVRLVHDAEHPTALFVPVGQAAEGTGC